MKNFRKLSALILSALASFTLLVGCGAAPVEDTTPTESAPVVPVVEKTAPETTPEATPEETPAPQSDTTEEKTESLREFRFTTGLGGANGDFLYDEDGRLSHITLGIYDDFSQDYDIHFDYTDGKASASFDAAQAAAMEGSPYVLEVTDLTLKADGTTRTVSPPSLPSRRRMWATRSPTPAPTMAA